MFDKFIDVAQVMRELKTSTSVVEKSNSFKEVLGNTNVSTDEDACNNFYNQELEWRNNELLAYRELVEQHKSIGTKTPQLLKFNKLNRKILKLIAKFINKAAYIITKDQNIVNNNILLSVDRLRESTILIHDEIQEANTLNAQAIRSNLNIVQNECLKKDNIDIILSKYFESNAAPTQDKVQEFLISIEDIQTSMRLVQEEFKNNIDAVAHRTDMSNKQIQEEFKSSIDAVNHRIDMSDKQTLLIKDEMTQMIGDLKSQINNLSKEVKGDIEHSRVDNRRVISRMQNKINSLFKPINQTQINDVKTITDKLINPTLNDVMYRDFEDIFRGSEETVTKRLEEYITYLNKFSYNKCLDLGCGRGEWLTLLVENGYDALGVDMNKNFIDLCTAKGLKAEYGDALSYLQSLEDSSVDVITGFHIIEHIPAEQLVLIISECNRVLISNGMLIFETPNPQNIVVGACNFYLDSTHERPVHPERIRFQMEYFGFSDIDYIYWQKENIKYVDELKESIMSSDLAPMIKELLIQSNRYMNCPGDYGIVGRKA